jgi:hypothetical protein
VRKYTSPFCAAAAHPDHESTFNILGFAPSVTSVVYIDGLVGFMYVERPHDAAGYEETFERLLQVALTPQESIARQADMGAGRNS